VRAVDTNLLVRALVRDDAAQSAAAESVLANEPVFIPVTVMLELEWVLPEFLKENEYKIIYNLIRALIFVDIYYFIILIFII
jgi:predicted nucleic-acid-binding protein